MKKEGEEQHNLMKGFITLVSYLHSFGARYEPHAATERKKTQKKDDVICL